MKQTNKKKSFQNSESIQHTTAQNTVYSTKKKIVQTNEEKKMMYTAAKSK